MKDFEIYLFLRKMLFLPQNPQKIRPTSLLALRNFCFSVTSPPKIWYSALQPSEIPRFCLRLQKISLTRVCVYIKWNGSHSPRAKYFLLNLFNPCDLNSRTAYLPAEESALLFTATFESRTSCLLSSVIDSLLSWGAEGDAVLDGQKVARHFEHFNGSSWSSSRTASLQWGHFILCVLGNLFPSTSKGIHLSCKRVLFHQTRKWVVSWKQRLEDIVP